MKQNGYGGANTLTGLVFEGEVDLKTFLSGQNDYKIIEHDVFYKGKLVANIYKKHDFYKYFLKPHGIDYIHSVRCQYYFGYIPLQKLGLPVPGVD